MKTKIMFTIIILSIILFAACANEDGDPKATGRFESVNSGTFTCYIDESDWDILKPVIRMYDSAYEKIDAEFIKADSREAMAQLLSANAEAIVSSRDYLKDEDSLMKVYKVKKHARTTFAIDALVFFTQNFFPIDTLNKAQLYDVFTKENIELSDSYTQLTEEPEFVCSEYTTSEFANFKKLVTSDLLLRTKVKLLEDYLAVKEYVRANPNAIGITHFSHVVNDNDLKKLTVGFVDSIGKRIVPKYPVHQANLVRGLYPYIVNHYVYQLEDRQNRVFWFAKFLERETIVQAYFNNFGIVPAFAKIKLIDNN